MQYSTESILESVSSVQSLVDQKIATIYYIDESLQSLTFIYFCSSGSPIRKSALGYFNMVVVVAFLVSLSTKFENTASGMYLGSRIPSMQVDFAIAS